MFDVLKNLYAKADPDVRETSTPFVMWVWTLKYRSDASTVRRLVDPGKGTHSLVRLLNKVGRKGVAETLTKMCEPIKDFVDGDIAHNSVSPKLDELNLTQLRRAQGGLWRAYKNLYQDSYGVDPPREDIDRTWVEAFMAPWLVDPMLLWWNRPKPSRPD